MVAIPEIRGSSMAKIPISVCIISKNEEKHIEECLKRLLPYGFEIIVTDTGSTDRTKELALKYTDKVYDFEWINDFAAARNFCASKASNNWILALDCDEYLGTADIAAIRILMQKFPRAAGVIRLKNLINKSDDDKTYSTDDVTRFYNKNFFTFDGSIHEQVCFINVEKRKETMPCFLLPVEVVHHGYDLSPEEMEIKQKRNLDMLYASLDGKEDDPYMLFQIGQSEFVLNNCEKAALYYEKALALNPSIEYLYVQVAVESLAKAYMMLGRREDALSLLEGYSKQCTTAKFTFVYASVLYDNGQLLKALMYYIKVTAMSDKDTLGENLLRCYERIVEIYHRMGNDEMANVFDKQYKECIEERKRVLAG